METAMTMQVPKSLIGKSVRWRFKEGPTKGMTFEHVFDRNGKVTWTIVEATTKRQPRGKANKPSNGESKQRRSHESSEAGKCAVERVTSTVHVVSYPLTVVLNCENMSVLSFASNDKGWYPAKGTFAIVR